MKRSTARWTTAMAAAALIALPSAGFAQASTTPQSQPQSQATHPTTSSSQPTSGSQTADSPADHVREAKQALSEIQTSSVPASARGKISQIKTHLNNLEKEVARGSAAESTSPSATASKTPGSAASASKWGTEVSAIDKIITELVGSDTGASTAPSASAPGATGTSGSANGTLDDASKEKLREVRKHVTALAASMSSHSTTPPSAAANTSPASSAADTMGSAPSSSSMNSAAAGSSTAANAGENPTTSPSAAPSSSAASSTASQQPETAQSATASQPSQSSTASQSPQSSTATEPTQSATAGSQAPASGQVDAQAAKQHLSDAREALSQLTALPEASRLQGEARSQVSKLISDFNELITTQNDWKAAYAKVETDVNALIGPETGAEAAPAPTAQPNPSETPTGTTGTNAAGGQIDPAIRAKLVEFRAQLKQFEQAAGGGGATASSSGSMAPSVNTASSTNPSNPDTAQNPATPSSATAQSASPSSASPSAAAPSTSGATGTSGASSATAGATGTSGSMSAADQQLQAIDAILNGAKDGKLDKAQVEQLKAHVEQLRQAVNSGNPRN